MILMKPEKVRVAPDGELSVKWWWPSLTWDTSQALGSAANATPTPKHSFAVGKRPQTSFHSP
jgi:hypothetical protein